MSARTFKTGRVHQKRSGVASGRDGRRGGTRAEAMYEDEPKWHWSDSVTLVALEAKLAQIKAEILKPETSVTLDPNL